jgi:hypothetical protein
MLGGRLRRKARVKVDNDDVLVWNVCVFDDDILL